MSTQESCQLHTALGNVIMCDNPQIPRQYPSLKNEGKIKRASSNIQFLYFLAPSIYFLSTLLFQGKIVTRADMGPNAAKMITSDDSETVT